jgi:hypothetical protein
MTFETTKTELRTAMKYRELLFFKTLEPHPRMAYNDLVGKPKYNRAVGGMARPMRFAAAEELGNSTLFATGGTCARAERARNTTDEGWLIP